MRKIGGRLVSLVLVSVLALSGVPCAMTAHAEEADTGITAAQTEAKKESLEEVSEGTLTVDAENFPDAAFRSYLLEKFDGDNDQKIDPASVTSIEINYMSTPNSQKISSFEGIQYFTELSTFGCTSDSELVSLDLSQNTALTMLMCINNNKLTSLDLSNNTKLTTIDCANNGLLNLNASGCTELTTLSCGSNQLASLNVSGCTGLTSLSCENNQLVGLDVSDCTGLTSLSCANNQLAGLNVSGCTKLTSLSCNDNRLTSLDLEKNTVLTKLDCYNNELTSLDLTYNTGLNSLAYDYDKVQNMSLDNLESLSFLSLHFQELPQSGTLDLSGLGYQVEGKDMKTINYELLFLNGVYMSIVNVQYAGSHGLTIYANKLEGTPEASDLLEVNEKNFPDEVFRNYLLEKFDNDKDGFIKPADVDSIDIGVDDPSDHTSGVSSLKGIEYLPYVTSLDCHNNNLTSLDLSGKRNLIHLFCSGNKITVLNLDECINLSSLDCSNNNLDSLDVSKCMSLDNLSCSGNNLSSLDVSNCTKLDMLSCDNNQLTNLNVGACNLNQIICDHNQLVELDVSKNGRLQFLICSSNNLSSLDVSKNTALFSLECHCNNLTRLDLNNNPDLYFLSYDYDKVSGLNLSNLKSLKSLYLYFQELQESGTLDLSGLGYQVEGLDMRNINYLLSKTENEESYQWSQRGLSSLSIYAKKILQSETTDPDTPDPDTPNPDIPNPDTPDPNPPVSDMLPTPTVTGIYHLLQDRNGIVAGLCTEGIDKSKYEFSWYVCKDGKNWIMAQDWTAGNEWLSYQPDENGDYVLVGKVRPIGGDDTNTVQESSYFSYHHEIYGKCQMPYDGEGGGYLIGFETYENPNQSYQYEMLVLDCTKLANGEDAWIYTTGKCGAGDGKALWTVWQPQYGYYWTLFRVYDADGNIIDEACYGFANI